MTKTFHFQNDQDFVNIYLKEIRPYPVLTQKEERILLLEYKTNKSKEAFNNLITSNLRFVVSVSVKYQNQGLAMPELINEGNLGLIEAVKRFNLDNNVKFISYAVWWIRQSIIKALYEKSRLVRVSAEKESKLKRVNRLAELSLQEFGYIDYNFVAKRSESKNYEVEQILGLSNNRISMDEPLGDDNDSTIYDLMTDDKSESPDAFLFDEGTRHSLHEMMDSLNEQEKFVVEYYYGLGLETDFNLEQIGKKLRISKERVRQIKKKALEKMKQTGMSYSLANCA